MNPHIKELFDLTGKVAVVTGGAGWLGSYLTEALAQAGAKVVIIDYNKEVLEKTVDKFKSDGLDVVGIEGDIISDEQSIRECIDRVVADCGQLDVLVNCAVIQVGAELDKASLKDFETAFSNAGAYAIVAQQAVTHMRKVGKGVIINLGSMYGIVTSYPDVYEGITAPASITYSAQKAAVIHSTRYMAVYWAKDNIRVNCLCPGAFPNRDNKAYEDNPKMPEFMQRLDKKTPLGRTGQPWELKGAVVFLASDASSFMTGQELVIDGGWTTW